MVLKTNPKCFFYLKNLPQKSSFVNPILFLTFSKKIGCGFGGSRSLVAYPAFITNTGKSKSVLPYDPCIVLSICSSSWASLEIGVWTAVVVSHPAETRLGIGHDCPVRGLDVGTLTILVIRVGMMLSVMGSPKVVAELMSQGKDSEGTPFSGDAYGIASVK